MGEGVLEHPLGGREFLRSGKSCQREGGVKNACHPSGRGGGVFFWNNPIFVGLFQEFLLFLT